MQLALLAVQLLHRAHTVTVASFYPGGRISQELEDKGVRVVSLDKRGRWDVIPFLARLKRLVGAENPDVVYSYLPVPNIFSILAARGRGIVWGIRASHAELDSYDWTWRMVDRLESRFSSRSDAIICNSQAGLKRCLERGFDQKKLFCVENGIDVEYFQFDKPGRMQMRQAWGLSESEIVVGIVGRIDPVKQHEHFIRAAAHLKNQKFRWVIVGEGSETVKTELKRLDQELGAGIIWAGRSDNMPAIYSALDLTVLCSKSEGFPNVVAESLSCGTPVVAYPVGDAEMIIDDPRCIAQPDPTGFKLANAIQENLLRHAEFDRTELRMRVSNRFSVNAMVDHTEQILCGLNSVIVSS